MRPAEIPRELVAWFPTVDYDACTGDRECLGFCKNDVFVWDEVEDRPIVRNPYNCVLGCQACVNVCPADAITFPSREDLRRWLRELRARAGGPAP